MARRHLSFDSSVARLHEVLEGKALNSLGEVLHPPGAGVRQRLWQATTGDPDRALAAAAAAARAGDGLQLSRATAWRGTSIREAQRLQAETIDAHRTAWTEPDRPPRVQVSRAVYPHPDRDEALRLVTPGVRRWQSWLSAKREVAGLTVGEYLEGDHSLLGPPETLAAELAADPALRQVTDLLVSFTPGVPDFAEHLRLLEEQRKGTGPDTRLAGTRHHHWRNPMSPTPMSPTPIAARYGDPDARLEVVNDVVRVQLAHRSVRKFAPREVTDPELTALIAAAQSAPTSSNLQPWSVVAVRDPERRARLAALAADQQFIAQAPLFLV